MQENAKKEAVSEIVHGGFVGLKNKKIRAFITRGFGQAPRLSAPREKSGSGNPSAPFSCFQCVLRETWAAKTSSVSIAETCHKQKGGFGYLLGVTQTPAGVAPVQSTKGGEPRFWGRRKEYFRIGVMAQRTPKRLSAK